MLTRKISKLTTNKKNEILVKIIKEYLKPKQLEYLEKDFGMLNTEQEWDEKERKEQEDKNFASRLPITVKA